MGVKAGEVIKKLISLGVMATINQTLDPTLRRWLPPTSSIR